MDKNSNTISDDGQFVDPDVMGRLKFDKNGLIPAIVKDASTGETLTLAYMNLESLKISIEEGRTCFYSRSRKTLWRKGETSGNIQWISRIVADCDFDALVVDVKREGPACHLKKNSCFHNSLFLSEKQINNEGSGTASDDSMNSPVTFTVHELYKLICERKSLRPEGSYTTYLFDKGIEKILKKVGEETSEVIIAAMKGNREETVYETADLCYHMLVLLCDMGIDPSLIVSELSRRHRS